MGRDPTPETRNEKPVFAFLTGNVLDLDEDVLLAVSEGALSDLLRSLFNRAIADLKSAIQMGSTVGAARGDTGPFAVPSAGMGMIEKH